MFSTVDHRVVDQEEKRGREADENDRVERHSEGEQHEPGDHERDRHRSDGYECGSEPEEEQADRQRSQESADQQGDGEIVE